MNHTIICKSNGDLFGSGYNYYGQLGLGHNNEIHSITAIPQKADSVCIGSHYTAVIFNNRLYFAGKNGSGQFGFGDHVNRNIFTIVPQLRVSQIACGRSHTVILTTSGEVFSSGSNRYGQLGLSHKLDVSEFVPLGFKATQIACGYNHTAILNNRYHVLLCGSNKHGQIDENKSGYIHQSRILGANKIYCGPNSTFAIVSNALYACGDNRCGQLGFPDFASPHGLGKHKLTAVPKIYFGKKHTILAFADKVVFFGNNQLFQLFGFPMPEAKNTPMTKNMHITSAILGDYHTVVRTGGVYLVCGDNSFGQLGIGHSDIIRELIIAPY